MDFLPIVRREALVAARRGSLYRTRYIAGFIAAAGAIGALMWASNVWMFSNSPGRFLFWFSSAMAALFAAGSGMFLTVDTLSREKRQNTLGLLFLTELRGYDIVLGKFASASAKAMSAYLTWIPILALAVCVGGVTGRQFWRTTLALLVLLFFSLCLGLLISAFFRREGPGVALFCAIMFLPVLAGYIVVYHSGKAVDPSWLVWNPFYPLLAASELDLGLAPPFFMMPLLRIPGDHYAGSLAATLVMGMGCLALATFLLPRTVRSGGPGPGWSRVLAKWKRPPRWRRDSLLTLHRHPAVWLAVKDKSTAVTLWALLAGALVFYWYDPFSASYPDLAGLFYPLLAHYILKWHVAYEAGKLISQEKESGVLETLLTTPMNAALLLRSKQLALRRYFLPPLLFVLVVHGWYIFKSLQADYVGPGVAIAYASVGVLLVDFFALSWLGFWQGLSTRRAIEAFFRTLLLGLLMPWVPFFLIVALIAFIVGKDFAVPASLLLAWGFVSASIVGVGLALWALGRAHYQLRKRIAEVE